MTHEQKIKRGTVVIFILSMILLFCLCAATTLAYFAGRQENHTILVMGGPVTVDMVDGSFNQIGNGNLVMELKSSRGTLLPGMGIDMQAIAQVKSTDANSTNALLRAILDIDVQGVKDQSYIARIKSQIRSSMADCLTYRIDSNEANARDGWVQYADGHYYYCDQMKGLNLTTGEQFIQLKSIKTSEIGNNVTFINGTFQFPYRFYVNDYADVEITFTLTFQAIQDTLILEDEETGMKYRAPNTIANVAEILNRVNWDKHNNETYGS